MKNWRAFSSCTSQWQWAPATKRIATRGLQLLGLLEVMRAQPPAHPGLVTLKSLDDSVLSPQQSTILRVKKKKKSHRCSKWTCPADCHSDSPRKNKGTIKEFSCVICYRRHAALREQCSAQLLTRRPPPLGCPSTDPTPLQTPWWDNSIPLGNRERERKSTEPRQGCFISSPCDSPGLNGLSLFFPYCNLDTMPV